MNWNYTGVILTGGKSTRMGTPKQNIILPNCKSMLENIIENLSFICKKIIIVGDTSLKLTAYKSEIIKINDIFPHLGPLGGLYTILKNNFDSQYLVIGCDQPSVDKDILLKLKHNGDYEITLFKNNKNLKLQPFPGIYSNALYDRVANQIKMNDVSMQSLIKQSKVNFIDLDESKLKFIKSINTKEELLFSFPQLVEAQ